MSVIQRRVLLEAIIQRDGDACILCRKSPVKDKTLDHLNGIIRDDRLENLHLMCRGCNTAERNRAARGSRILTTETIAAHRARLGLSPLPKSQVTPVCVGQPRGQRWALTTADEANLVLEPPYRLWLFQQVQAHGGISKTDAINAGAEYLHRSVGKGSPATTDRYFQKVISSMGWLTEIRNANGHPIWAFRDGEDLKTLENSLKEHLGSNGQGL